jgi:hypothetical protein
MRFASILLQNAALATGYIFKQSARNNHQRSLLPTVHTLSHQNNIGQFCSFTSSSTTSKPPPLRGWVQDKDGEWSWEEDDPNFEQPSEMQVKSPVTAVATPQLPSGSFAPKKSLGQNYLKDPNTVLKILRAFDKDATHNGEKTIRRVVELGPGAGALTDRLVEIYGTDVVQCIELDERSIGILTKKHPGLEVTHADILQVNYPQMAEQEGQALVVIGNLPYYITSQILFALADASHFGAVDTATVTMQWEVGQRMVAPIRTKVCPFLFVFCFDRAVLFLNSILTNYPSFPYFIKRIMAS